jgi:putative cell wall-binding protein
MGAHAGGFNSETLGIAVLGTFTTTALPAAVEDALVPLLAWKAAAYGINPVGRTTLTSGGGSYTRYAAGTPVSVYGVSGHRDVDSTECPGDAAYPRLPTLRARAAALMVPALVAPALTDVPTTVAGRAVGFTATIPTRQRWWLTVTRLCGGLPVRVVSGTSTGRIAGSWDLRDAAGHPVPPGDYRVTVTSSSPVGSVAPFGRDVEVLATPESLAASSPGPVAGSATGAAVAPVAAGQPVSRIPMPVISPSSAPRPTAAPTATAGPTATPAPTTTPSTTPPPSGSPSPSGSPAPTPPALPTAGSDGCAVQRAAGTDPALTSVVAGRLAHPDAHAVVLVNGSAGEPLAEALAAAPLAAAKGAPLLLTDAAALPAVVAQDVTARHATTAWLVGSATVISPAVEQQLRGLGVTTVTRVAGVDRWTSAAAVAGAVGAPAHQALLAPGDSGEQLDTLVAAGSAAAAGQPILLTSRTGVPGATLAALKALHVTTVTVIGSTVAVPEATLRALATAGVAHYTRVVGRDRWTTAVAVAARFAAQAPADRVVLASGSAADAALLVASGGGGRPVLLTGSSDLPAATGAWLAARPGLGVALVAGPDAVPTATLRAVQSTRTPR